MTLSLFLYFAATFVAAFFLGQFFGYLIGYKVGSEAVAKALLGHGQNLINAARRAGATPAVVDETAN